MQTNSGRQEPPLRARLGVAILVLLACAMIAVGGCFIGGGQHEGERCNPDLSHNDCDTDLTCQVTADQASGATCGESYCCPTSATSSPLGNCNGQSFAPIPLSDGGLQLVCPIPAPAGDD